MMKIEAWRSDNGQLETDPIRAKAHDIAKFMGERAKDAAVGTSGVPASKVDWHAAMELLKHAETVIEHLQEYLTLKGQINAAKEDQES